MAEEGPFEGPAPASDPRWAVEDRLYLLAWERRQRWIVGFRKHLVRQHGTNNADACGCGVHVPDYVVSGQWHVLGDDRLHG